MFITKVFILIIIASITNINNTSALKLECTYREPDLHWEAFSRDYTCEGTIRLDGDDENIRTVTNTHREQMRNADVRGLMIVQQRDLQKFPKGLERHFHHLIGIDFEDCGLTKISSDDLMPFKELLQINLSGNRLTELPNDLFQFNPKLKKIDLSGNLIMHVGLEIFNNLQHLTMINMHDNACTSDNAYATKKEELKELVWELSVECPPTLDMLSSSLFGSKEFIDNIKRISGEDSDDVRNELLNEIQGLEKIVQELKRRL
ncbi:unnamed protein product [Chironomus riparius]|uniref:Uncharacterized protein n=1 Tax=Chironomus riparius TaxID=315576 RepID=A0A9P0JAE9_9DIPT|nr:unnamed protein product [Chironomus riparius]